MKTGALVKRAKKYEKAKGASIKSMVAAAIRQVSEKKFFDSSLGSSAPSATGAIQSGLLFMANGTDDQTRIGNSINVTSIGYKFVGTLATSETTENAVRVILFRDIQSNGAAPTVADVLTTAAFDSYFNPDNVERFEILDDRIIRVGACTGTTTAILPMIATSNCYKKLSFKSTYTSNSAIVPSSNNLCILTIGRNTAGTYTFRIRARYTDA